MHILLLKYEVRGSSWKSLDRVEDKSIAYCAEVPMLSSIGFLPLVSP
jgi:hypothetical protein